MPSLRELRRRLAAWIEPKRPGPVDEYYLLVKGQPFTLPFDHSITLSAYLDVVHVQGFPSEECRRLLRQHVRAGELLRFATYAELRTEIDYRRRVLAYGDLAR